jgi:hypothetical protein
MPVMYDNKKLIPAPFISISEDRVLRDDGAELGKTYQITLTGKLIANRGSPNSNKVFYTGSGYPGDESIATDSRLSAILRKQEALRDLFSTNGLSLEVQGYDGMGPFKCNPKVRRIDFPSGEGKGANWTEYCEYTITLEADIVLGVGEAYPITPKISKFNREWNIETLDETKKTFRLTHSISATGKRFFLEDGSLEKEAWQQAKDYVLNSVGLGIDANKMVSSGVVNGDNLQAFNYLRSNNINETNGTFGVVESWVCYNPNGEPPALHESTVDVRNSQTDNITTVSVNGSVTGFEVRNTTTQALLSNRYANAAGKWANNIKPYLHSVAQQFGGVTLNAVPVNTQVGINELSGTITYNYEFNNRPGTYVPGAITESITVTTHNQAHVFATIPVLGRPMGPILQSANTLSAKRASISIEAQLVANTGGGLSRAAPNTNSIVLSLMPVGLMVFMEQDEESWNPMTGRYTRNTMFVWE